MALFISGHFMGGNNKVFKNYLISEKMDTTLTKFTLLSKFFQILAIGYLTLPMA